MRIVLASASPRRRELLSQIGLEFEVKVSDVEEKITATAPAEVVQELAGQKAEAVRRMLAREEGSALDESCQRNEGSMLDAGNNAGKFPEALLVIGADTVVACDGEILGKPQDAEDAKRMLRLLAGRSHEVYTGVALIFCPCGSGQERTESRQAEQPDGDCPRKSGQEGADCVTRTFYEATTVHFFPMTEEEIAGYVATKDPLDKAGAYGIQGFCARYISGIEGDYNNVVGLPVGRLYQEVKEWL